MAPNPGVRIVVDDADGEGDQLAELKLTGRERWSAGLLLRSAWATF